MKRKVFIFFVSIYILLFFTAIIFFAAWKIDFKKHDMLTEKYGSEFESYYVHNNESEFKYLSVLDYSPRYARVYYFFENKTKGEILELIKTNDNWETK